MVHSIRTSETSTVACSGMWDDYDKGQGTIFLDERFKTSFGGAGEQGDLARVSHAWNDRLVPSMDRNRT